MVNGGITGPVNQTVFVNVSNTVQFKVGYSVGQQDEKDHLY